MAEFGKELFDYLRQFDAGVNEGIDPSLLQHNELSEAINLTVRGTYASMRSAYRKINLNFASNDVKTGAETGLWQGACFYKPDSGPESLVASIGGRLFQFVPDQNGNASVTEKTIPGDPNPTSQSQAWMWQSESFVICNDGLSLPIFFDGTNSRRSLGAINVLATLAANFTVPSVNSSVAVTLTSAYSGPINIPVLLNGKSYQLTQQTVAGSSNAQLTTLYDTATTEPTGSAIKIVPGNVGVILAPLSGGSGTFTIPISYPSNGNGLSTVAIGSTVLVGSRGYTVNAVTNTGSGWTITLTTPSAGFSQPAGTLMRRSTSDPSIQLGTLSATFTVPAVGSASPIQMSVPYTGASQVVWIGNAQYIIDQVSIAPSVNIVLVNLNDIPGNTVLSGTTINSLPELPAGRMGVYGLGRNWMALTDGRSFIASDIVGGSSGTRAYSFRDAPLHITENTYLAGGGTFTVPSSGGDIRAMIFASTLDASLGQGPLQVLTPYNVFSCNAPVERITWQSITNPILTESLIANGGQGQDATIAVNGDTLFRSIDGIRSLILARRDFNTWGNVPISLEVSPTLDTDNVSLLSYGRAALFDNRAIFTANPIQSNQGIYHTKLIALNLDPISSLRGKAPSIYDGVWDGLNVLQLRTGTFSNVSRLFAFHLNTTTNTIELWEILPSETTITGTNPITMDLSSATLDFGQPDPRKRDFKRLLDGEIFVDELKGQLRFTAYYKPAQWPNWVKWHSWIVNVDPVSDPGYRPTMGLGEPSTDPVDNVNNMPLREAFDYRFRLVIEGLTADSHAQFRGARFKAVTIPTPEFSPPS